MLVNKIFRRAYVSAKTIDCTLQGTRSTINFCQFKFSNTFPKRATEENSWDDTESKHSLLVRSGSTTAQDHLPWATTNDSSLTATYVYGVVGLMVAVHFKIHVSKPRQTHCYETFHDNNITLFWRDWQNTIKVLLKNGDYGTKCIDTLIQFRKMRNEHLNRITTT